MVLALIIPTDRHAESKNRTLSAVRAREAKTDVIITNALTISTKKETLKRRRDCGALIANEQGWRNVSTSSRVHAAYVTTAGNLRASVKSSTVEVDLQTASFHRELLLLSPLLTL